MTSDNAGKLAFGCGALLAVMTVAQQKDDGKRLRSLLAIGVLTLGLSVLADVAPQVAGPFAVLIAVAAVARNPGVIGRTIGFEGGSK